MACIGVAIIAPGGKIIPAACVTAPVTDGATSDSATVDLTVVGSTMPVDAPVDGVLLVGVCKCDWYTICGIVTACGTLLLPGTTCGTI